MKVISDRIDNYKNIRFLKKIKKIEKDDIFHRFDVFTLNELDDIFDKFGTPGVFLSDHVTHFENFKKNIEFIGVPIWLESQRQMWSKEEFTNDQIFTNYCFNFMINKKQVNRYLCIKLVELYNFKNFIYTWSGIGRNFDCKDIITEHQMLGVQSPLDSTRFSKILSPIMLDPIFYKDNTIQKEIEHDGCHVANYGGNRNSWDWGCSKLFFESAVSLITESLTYQKASTFTEKTLYSVLGASFPIWVGGGNRQEEMWKKLGFDTFSDVINHDYQYYDTLLERCFYAFELNKKILIDLDFAKSVRSKNMDRLISNRNLILSGKLTEYISAEIKKHYPNEIPLGIQEILDNFNIDNCQFA